MKIVFKKPERKLDSFLVPIRDGRQENKGHGGKVRIRMVDDIVLQKVLRVRDQDAHVLQCLVRDTGIQDRLQAYDEQVLQHVLENCNTWFGTDLSEEKIRDMFLPSLNERMELMALVSSIIEPDVMLNGTVLNGFCELLPFLESHDDLTNLCIVLEIDAQGIYIRSKRFGIRWIVKHIRIVQEDTVHTDTPFDLCTRIDVNQQLQEDIEEVEEQVNEEIGELEAKIHNLRGFIHRARDLLQDARGIGSMDSPEAEKEWASKTESLSKLVRNYQRGRS